MLNCQVIETKFFKKNYKKVEIIAKNGLILRKSRFFLRGKSRRKGRLLIFNSTNCLIILFLFRWEKANVVYRLANAAH